MQQRHLNRRQYFRELANTSRKFYLDYLQTYITLTSDTRVLEIGCGEGGNLLPFAEKGCRVTGIDICQSRINEAKAFFTECHQQGTFSCQDFLLSEEPKTENERYHLVLVHDVIEHIGDKHRFLSLLPHFLANDGIIFMSFPAWQMPFGGHQQICRREVSHLPFIHLLPTALYRWLLQASGEDKACIKELMSIKETRTPIELFERTLKSIDTLTIADRTLWLINPHYETKFGLRPRRLPVWLSAIPYIRNFFTTSCFYVLSCNHDK